jgi:predicted Rossmann fold flavoprotein
MGVGLTSLKAETDGSFTLGLSDDTAPRADAVCIASGSLKSSPITQAIEALGHTIEPLVPSLFAFDLSDARIQDLAGLSVQNVSVKALPDGPAQVGPILITHRGFSGPAILRLSSWEARKLQAADYRFEISINWLGDVSEKEVIDRFDDLRLTKGRTAVKTKPFEEIPRRLWERIVSAADIADKTQWSQLSSKHRDALADELVAARFKVQGKTTNKEEFVTCGGVGLKEIDFRTMESRKVPGLHFAGECLDIDGITGGFNFQSAWTTGYLSGLSLASVRR